MRYIDRVREITLVEWLVVGTLVVILPLVIVVGIAEHREWQQYVEDNGCRVTESRRDTYYDFNLKMPVDRIERKWECRNGEIHWR